MKSKITTIITVAIFGLMLLFSPTIFPITSNIKAQGQLQQKQPQKQENNNNNNLHVKITYPIRGQQILAGSAITIFGTSTDDAIKNCTVYAGWDDMKPFRKALPTGPSSRLNDYSTWIFTYINDYHQIEEGDNKLTAQFSCYNNPVNLTSYDSVNVTGVTMISGRQQSQLQNQTQQESPLLSSQISAASSNENKKNEGSIILPDNNHSAALDITNTNSALANSNNDLPFLFPSFPRSFSYNSSRNTDLPFPSELSANDSDLKQLEISATVAKNPIVWGNEQTLTVAVYNASSHEKVNAAIVRGTITETADASSTAATVATTQSSSPSKATNNEFMITTNSIGQASYQWLIGPGNSKQGTYTVALQVSALNYKETSDKVTFGIIPPTVNKTSVLTIENMNNNAAAPSTTSMSLNRTK
jgi:hypothetical protein